jgi:putative FmdB family regulatory protein
MLRRHDFRCTKCNHVEEHWVDSSEEFVSCLECGDTAKRIISPIQTQFVGQGWPDKDDKWAKDHERAARK